MKLFCLFLIISFGVIPVFTINSRGDQGNVEVIVDNSGSSNFSGYRVIIEADGQVKVMDHGRSSINSAYKNGQYTLPVQVVRKLFSDLEAVMPLSGLESIGCAKSASFGTTTFVTYKGQTSPDIQCMKSEAFIKDISQIMLAIPRAQIGVKMP